MYQDKIIKCKDCDAEFVFSAAEQENFDAQGFESKPIRCKSCRGKRQGIRGKKGQMPG